jgi:hypothetical protein
VGRGIQRDAAPARLSDVGVGRYRALPLSAPTALRKEIQLSATRETVVDEE